MPSRDLAVELRAARPLAPAELRERVRAVAAQAPEPRHRVLLPSLRRAVVVGAAAVLVVSFGVATIYGLVHSRSPARRDLAAAQPTRAAVEARPVPRAGPPRAARTLLLPHTASRLQQYNASLQVQVDDREALSLSTRRAMRIARLLGGYVASVQYSAPRHRRGSATLVVRVPIDRVQDAIEEYSGLGTLLAQKVRITDVTKAVAEETKEIARLRAEVERLEAGGVSPSERPRYDAERARLDFLTKKKNATVRRAELARISLRLATKPKPAAATAGRFHRTVRSAAVVLVREAELLLYALIVAGPLLLVGAAAIGVARLAQRRRDAQLLNRV